MIAVGSTLVETVTGKRAVYAGLWFDGDKCAYRAFVLDPDLREVDNFDAYAGCAVDEAYSDYLIRKGYIESPVYFECLDPELFDDSDREALFAALAG
jgi:hypothetical protein